MTGPSFVVELETLRHFQGPVRPVGELSRRGKASWRQGCPCCASNSKPPPHPMAKGPLSTSPHLNSPSTSPPARSTTTPPHQNSRLQPLDCLFLPSDPLLGDLHRPLACGLRDTAVRRTDSCSRVQKATVFGRRRPSWMDRTNSVFLFLLIAMQFHRSRPSILQITCASNCLCQDHCQLSLAIETLMALKAQPSPTPTTTRNIR